MEITTVLATKEPFEFYGKTMRFTEDDLVRMAKSASGVPISLKWEPHELLGVIKSAEYKNEQLWCTFDLKRRPFGKKPTFIVPGTQYNHKTKAHESLFECAITDAPTQSLESF